MKFSRNRKIENNVFETKIAFKVFGGDAIYDEAEEKRLVNDFGFPSIEIGYIQGKYDVKEENGKKKVIVTAAPETIASYEFEDNPLEDEYGGPIDAMSTSGTEVALTVCAEERGKKVLNEKFEVLFRLPVKDAQGTPVSPAQLTSDELSEYEAKCRLFEETIIARAKLAIEALYEKDTIFEIEQDADEILIAKNTEKPIGITDGIYIG